MGATTASVIVAAVLMHGLDLSPGLAASLAGSQGKWAVKDLIRWLDDERLALLVQRVLSMGKGSNPRLYAGLLAALL